MNEQLRRQPRPFYMTREMYVDINARLQQAQHRFEVELPNQFRDAAHPDYRENSPKDVLDHEWSLLRREIAGLQDRLDRRAIIDDMHIDTSAVNPGTIVAILDDKGNQQQHLMLSVTDIQRGHLSIESPIGRALLGKRVGDIVEVKVDGNTQSMMVAWVRRYEPPPPQQSDILNKPATAAPDASKQKQPNSLKAEPAKPQAVKPPLPPSIPQATAQTRFAQIVRAIQHEGVPVSTRSQKNVILSDGSVGTQETIIFTYQGVLTKVEFTKKPATGQTQLKIYRFRETQWQLSG